MLILMSYWRSVWTTILRVKNPRGPVSAGRSTYSDVLFTRTQPCSLIEDSEEFPLVYVMIGDRGEGGKKSSHFEICSVKKYRYKIYLDHST